MSGIQVIVVDIDDLIPDDLNPNAGTARGESALEGALQKHGAGRGILVDRNMKILAGHHVVEAAKKAGIKKVRVAQTHGTQVVAAQRTDVDLDSTEGREMAVEDNRTHQVNLEWDAKALIAMEQAGADLTKFFLDHERRAIIPEFPAPSAAPEPQAAATTEKAEKGDRADKGDKTGTEGAAAPAAPPPSNAKTAQFFFDGSTYDLFCERLDALEKRFGTSGSADTILAAMRHVAFNSEAANAGHANDQAEG
jgi:hypothetical protein